MRNCTVALVAVLFVVMLTGCFTTGLDPKIMREQVTPITDYAKLKAAEEPDADTKAEIIKACNRLHDSIDKAEEGGDG